MHVQTKVLPLFLACHESVATKGPHFHSQILNVVRLVNDDGSSMDFVAMQAYTVQLIEELHEGGAMELQQTTTVIRKPLS